jgi:hypothetical protein
MEWRLQQFLSEFAFVGAKFKADLSQKLENNAIFKLGDSILQKRLLPGAPLKAPCHFSQKTDGLFQFR